MAIDINRIPVPGVTFWSRPVDNRPNPAISPAGSNQDTFESASPSRYTSEFMITKLVKSNQKINKILRSSGIPYKLNVDGLKCILDNHCTDTREIAEGIVNNLPFSLKNKADLQAIKEAAYLHDIGKVFIPEEILNKNGRLVGNEIDIMHKHSELGYELLKNSGLSPKTLHLIRNHHQNVKKNGYPAVGKNFFADLDLQILSIADKYSALTEARPYKPALGRVQALAIIYRDVREGKLNPIVYNALAAYTMKSELNTPATSVL